MKNLKQIRHDIKWKRIFILAVFFAVVFLIAFAGILPDKLSYNAGDIAQENIIAPKRIVDESMTNALREQAAEMTAPVYDYIPSAQANALSNVSRFYNGVKGVYNEYLDEASVQTINNVYCLSLGIEQYRALLSLNDTDYELLHQTTINIVNNLYSGGEVKASELEYYKNAAYSYALQSPFSEILQTLAGSVAADYVSPNMILNSAATKLVQDAARESVYEVVYEAGQTIVNKGEKVTEQDIRLFKANNMMKTGLFEQLSSSVGLPVLLILLIALFLLFMRYYYKSVYDDTKKMLVLGILFIIILIFAQLSSYFSVYLIPVSIFTMTVCLLFNSRAAVFLNFFLMLFLAVTMQLDIDAVLYLAISGYMGIIYMRRVTSRIEIFKSGLLVSATNILLVVTLSFLHNNIGISTVKAAVYALGNGMVASLFTNGLMLVWESVFNFVTPFKLLEMSGANDAVIQRLIADAPGTYYHSLIVSNLAESACAAIGADALLARVGAYYHDIGKAEKAIYFSENQTNGENPHDYVSPEASAKIIKNHVTDGVYLAEKHHIPKEISIFIETHHGTSEISYFKNKAQKQGYVGDENFKYNGKLPISKETSIVMLADSVEAAVRSLDEKSSEAIAEMISKIIDKKIKENQFSKSMLSFDDLEKLKESFLDVLNGVYHNRVKYPGQESL